MYKVQNQNKIRQRRKGNKKEREKKGEKKGSKKENKAMTHRISAERRWHVQVGHVIVVAGVSRCVRTSIRRRVLKGRRGRGGVDRTMSWHGCPMIDTTCKL